MPAKNPTPIPFCVQQLKVLADSTRLRVLKILMEGPKNVSEINHYLEIEQSLLSHHLQILRKAGFVQSNRVGKAVLYSLAPGIQPNSMQEIDLGCCLLSFE